MIHQRGSEVLNISYLNDRGFVYEYSGASIWKAMRWKYYILRRFLAFERFQRKTRCKGSLSKIKSLKGLYSGPAVIVGNGPSSLGLESLDLDSLRATHTIFCMNYYLMTDLSVQLPPHYLFLCDGNFWDDTSSRYRKLVKKYQKDFDLVLVQPDYLPNILSERSTLKIRKNPLTSFTRRISVSDIFCGFPNYTVFYMVATALHLGYSPVYMVGHDFNHYKFIEWHEGSFKLLPHHSYSEAIRSWPSRETISKILNANLQQLNALELFKSHPVYCLGEKPSHDVIPFVSFREVFETPKKSK